MPPRSGASRSLIHQNLYNHSQKYLLPNSPTPAKDPNENSGLLRKNWLIYLTWLKATTVCLQNFGPVYRYCMTFSVWHNEFNIWSKGCIRIQGKQVSTTHSDMRCKTDLNAKNTTMNNVADGLSVSKSNKTAAVMQVSRVPGKTWKSLPMPSSISEVTILTAGKVSQTLWMPSGAAMSVKNKILLSSTPLLRSTCREARGDERSDKRSLIALNP